MRTTYWLTAALALALGAGTMIYWSSGSKKSRRKVLGVIPARYKSSRFPGKPLAEILGKTMIQRTYEQALKAKKLDLVVVATDDERIAEECRRIGAPVVMTPGDCPNGTVRCFEALRRLPQSFNFVVNIQGDEPLIDPAIIDGVVAALQSSRDAPFSTAVTPLTPADASDPNRVKCILDQRGYALYFSRGLIPFNKKGVVDPTFQYYLHLGLTCFEAWFLGEYAEMEATPLQLQEDLEQLKVLENGYKIKVIVVKHAAHGVDTPEDIDRIEQLIRQSADTNLTM